MPVCLDENLSLLEMTEVVYIANVTSSTTWLVKGKEYKTLDLVTLYTKMKRRIAACHLVMRTGISISSKRSQEQIEN